MALAPPPSSLPLEGGMSRTTVGLACCEWLLGVCGGYLSALADFTLEHESPERASKQGVSALQVCGSSDHDRPAPAS